MKYLSACAIVSLLFNPFPYPLLGQEFDSSLSRLVTGQVLVQSGQQPPGRAIVKLYTDSSQFIAQTTTSTSGAYSFWGIGAGNYRIVVSLAGYEDGTADVAVYRGSSRTQVLPIVLTSTKESGAALPGGSIDAAELRLSRKARSQLSKARREITSGEVRKARERLLQITELEPLYAPGLRLLGQTEILAGNYLAAADVFGKAIALESQEPESYFGLAKALNLLNRPKDALAQAETGLALTPGSAAGLFEKSRSLFMLREFESAVEVASLSLNQSPPPPHEIHLILANSLINLRRYAAATRELEVYIGLQPNGTSTPKARELLEKLRKLSPSSN